jgi:hypothetical protein
MSKMPLVTVIDAFELLIVKGRVKVTTDVLFTGLIVKARKTLFAAVAVPPMLWLPEPFNTRLGELLDAVYTPLLTKFPPMFRTVPEFWCSKRPGTVFVLMVTLPVTVIVPPVNVSVG